MFSIPLCRVDCLKDTNQCFVVITIDTECGREATEKLKLHCLTSCVECGGGGVAMGASGHCGGDLGWN